MSFQGIGAENGVVTAVEGEVQGCEREAESAQENEKKGCEDQRSGDFRVAHIFLSAG